MGGRLPMPAQPSTFQEEWQARTEPRFTLLSSPNCAGNALRAWGTESHPPRMAPLGYLNCGSSFDEVLFKESLARHNVGSYFPGENVCMDPALRNRSSSCFNIGPTETSDANPSLAIESRAQRKVVQGLEARVVVGPGGHDVVRCEAGCPEVRLRPYSEDERPGWTK